MDRPIRRGDGAILQDEMAALLIILLQRIKHLPLRFDENALPFIFEDVGSNRIVRNSVVRPYLDEKKILVLHGSYGQIEKLRRFDPKPKGPANVISESIGGPPNDFS